MIAIFIAILAISTPVSSFTITNNQPTAINDIKITAIKLNDPVFAQ
jgi:hypothetical protein